MVIFPAEAKSMTSALNGVPSWNFTPARSLKVQVLPSAETLHDSASDGSTCVPSARKRTSVSNMFESMLTENPSSMSFGSSDTASSACAKTSVPPVAPQALASQDVRAIAAPCRFTGAISSAAVNSRTGTRIRNRYLNPTPPFEYRRTNTQGIRPPISGTARPVLPSRPPARQHLRVDRVGRAPPLQHRQQVLRRHHRHLRPGLDAGAGDVRHDDDVVQGEERVVGLYGLLLEDVKPGGPDPPLAQRLRQGQRVHDRPAGGVHQDGGALHHLQLLPADEVARLAHERHVDADEVPLPQHLLERPVLAPPLRLPLLPPDHIVVEDAHVKASCPAGHGAADAAQADQSQRRTVHVLAQEEHRLPGAPEVRPRVLIRLPYP